jgi:phosphomannomutase/phosphoglucomutase
MAEKSLFGTSGIRGDAKELFTNQFAFDLGRTFAIFLKQNNQLGKVAVGNDPRESSPRIKSALMSGLIYEGYEVFDQGVAPIPSMNYILLADPSYAGSVMVTGSHIKADLNGLKFFALKEEISKEHEALIEKIYSGEKEIVKYSDKTDVEIFSTEATESYKDYLISKALLPFPNWKVVIDPGNGAQSDVMPWVLRQLGVSLIEQNTSVQENFLTRDTEVQGDYKELQDKVLSEKADFGLGYDSDGDRLIVVNEKGESVVGDYTGAIIAKDQPGDEVVTPINASQVVELIGKKVERTKVGSPYVVAKMKEVNASFGFESNGGGIFKEMLSRDGGRSTVEFMNILSKAKTSVSELMSTLPAFYQSRDKVEYKWELKDKIITSAKEHFKGIKVEELDGLKIWIDENTWILFRSSSNAPEFRVFTEAKTQEEAQNLMNKGMQFVKDMVK